MFETLKKIDQQLLLFGNGLHHAFLDPIIFYLTDFWLWIPLFMWWLFELKKIYQKKLIPIVFYLIGLIITSDTISVLIKNMVKRYRPTHNLAIQHQVHTINNYVGGQYGYVSSHAANVFAVAVFLFLLLGSTDKKWLKISLFAWALFVCYTRIYLGVHYPLDLLSGALLGSTLGFLCYKIFKKFNTQNV